MVSLRVMYQQFGGPEVLKVVEVPDPQAGPGQVRVRVVAAGLNPVDYKIRNGGPIAAAFGVTPPAGIGSDFAGVVDQVGDGVADWQVGDEVLGGAAGALAEHLVLAPEALLAKPAGMPWEVAGSLGVAGRAAAASVASLELTAADVVLISAAAGGVGVIASQLALANGAKVVGTASVANHEFLAGLGVVPVAYGPGLVDRLRIAAPEGYSAVLDNHGADTIEVGLELGVPASRINSIAVFSAPEGVTFVGGRDATAEDLAHVVAGVADGSIKVPIQASYSLADVAAAFARLEQGHLLGKVVVTT